MDGRDDKEDKLEMDIQVDEGEEYEWEEIAEEYLKERERNGRKTKKVGREMVEETEEKERSYFAERDNLCTFCNRHHCLVLGIMSLSLRLPRTRLVALVVMVLRERARVCGVRVGVCVYMRAYVCMCVCMCVSVYVSLFVFVCLC